jgi:hypothetical protein
MYYFITSYLGRYLVTVIVGPCSSILWKILPILSKYSSLGSEASLVLARDLLSALGAPDDVTWGALSTGVGSEDDARVDRPAKA